MGTQRRYVTFANLRYGALEMADLAAGVAEHLTMESIGNIQLSNTNARNSSQEINSLLGRISAKRFDELDAVEGRSVSGVLGTPIAGPTNIAK